MQYDDLSAVESGEIADLIVVGKGLTREKGAAHVRGS